ncbi:MAG: DNA double-strand break repair nuclease NurA [Candidatus Micrarchaeota archaeon]|nr:DNA double-strand break repair nuclease NurA [Candidatus Micrarchaeota archaeon]
MPDRLAEIAEQIASTEHAREELARRLRFNSGKIEYAETLERELVHKVPVVPVDGTIAAVDGGIVGEELHGFNFLLMRAVGALFAYQGSKTVSYSYFPSSLPPMQYDVRSGLDSHDVMLHNSLFRLKGELSLAASLVQKHSPTCLMMDGSIAPLLSDKPSEDSEMRPLYEEVLAAYQSLYESSWRANTTLLGVIKDSRSRRFIDIVQKHSQNEPGFAHTSDTNFLYFMLEAGERTCAFPYSSSSKHPVLKDLGQWSEKILSFYLKPVKDDRPLRVEFLSGQRTFSEIASLVHSLSCQHKAYAYPAILIEADLRAAMPPDEFERAYGSLFSRLGRSASLMRLRRNERPFR